MSADLVMGRYMRRKHLADTLGVCERTIRIWEMQGLPVVRAGRTRLYDPEKVLKWIEAEPAAPRKRGRPRAA